VIGKIHIGTYYINKALHLEKDQIKLLLVLDGRDYIQSGASRSPEEDGMVTFGLQSRACISEMASK